MASTYKLDTVGRGDKNNCVLLLQEILKARGLYKGGLDRAFGPATEKAVIDYQTARIEAGAKLFAVKVHGESMRDAGILDGDVLIAQKTDSVKAGEVVIALLDDAVTVKYIYLTKGKWELRPAKPDFKSKFVELDALKVQGSVVGLVRKF